MSRNGTGEGAEVRSRWSEIGGEGRGCIPGGTWVGTARRPRRGGLQPIRRPKISQNGPKMAFWGGWGAMEGVLRALEGQNGLKRVQIPKIRKISSRKGRGGRKEPLGKAVASWRPWRAWRENSPCWIGQSSKPVARAKTSPAVAATLRSSTEMPARTAPRATWAAWSARCRRRRSAR